MLARWNPGIRRSALWLLVPLLVCALFALFLARSLPTQAAPAHDAHHAHGAHTPQQAPARGQAADPQGLYQLYEADLTGAEEVPPVNSQAFGRAVMSVDTANLILYYRVFVDDITGITAAHIHEAAPGTNGPVIFPLFTGGGPFDPTNPISGSLTLTPAQLTTLQSGNYYVNVHTSAVPSGEVRGQVQLFTIPAGSHAALLGTNEVPANASSAVGLARFNLIGTIMDYQVDVSDIVSITAAHIHFAPAGVNGPVVHGLYNGTGPFDPANPISGSVVLDAEDVLNLATGYFYVNVHTSAFPGGEIRGQIGTASVFEANLSGANEVPPNGSTATGRGVLALNEDASALDYRVSVSNIVSITAAHIHQAPAGSNGPVIFPIYGGGGPFDPSNPVSGTLAINAAQVLTMLGDDYYINVHTTTFPGGEIRGQIDGYTPSADYNASLLGSNEVPPVSTSASGLADLKLDPTNALQYRITVSNIPTVTAAHIHRAPVGRNGPVVHPIHPNGSIPFGNGQPIGGSVHLDSAGIVDLLTDWYYINVHTTVTPSGEIRGQIGVGQGPTAVTTAALGATTGREPLILAGAALALLGVAGAALVWRRRTT